MFGFKSKKRECLLFCLVVEVRRILTSTDDEASSPTVSSDHEGGIKNETNNFYDPDLPRTGGTLEHDDLNIVCPPHTTEKKLMAKIDLRVIPFLCILYLLAFLYVFSVAKIYHGG